MAIKEFTILRAAQFIYDHTLISVNLQNFKEKQ
jgi:hypothetical protein